MKFTILDVGHGSCAYVQDSNGALLVFDCGHKDEPEFRPSAVLPGAQSYNSRIDRLFISNFDQDHISDLPRLQERFSIRCFHRNRSLSAQDLRAMKERTGVITNAMSELIGMHITYTGPEDALPTPNISWETYSNSYPEFAETNDLSMVTFLDIDGFRVVFPGDLERPGWLSLLRNTGFKAALSRGVDVLVASHHGRENGYCPEVFTVSGEVGAVVFSDSSIRHASQSMANTYARHARGVPFNGQNRRVLTTRNDGTLVWDF